MSALAAASAAALVGETTGLSVVGVREQAPDATSPLKSANGTHPELGAARESSLGDEQRTTVRDPAAEPTAFEPPEETNAFLRVAEFRIVGEDLIPSGQAPQLTAQEQIEEQSATIARIIQQFEATLEQIDRIVESQVAENAAGTPATELSPLTRRADRLLDRVIETTSELLGVYSVIEDQTLTSPSRDHLNVVF